MTPTLALAVGGPLMLMLGIMIALLAGAAGGFVLGTQLGRASPATPLPTTIRLARDELAATVTRLEKASAKLNAAQRSDLAGAALVVGRRVTDVSSALGALGHKTKVEEGTA